MLLKRSKTNCLQFQCIYVIFFYIIQGKNVVRAPILPFIKYTNINTMGSLTQSQQNKRAHTLVKPHLKKKLVHKMGVLPGSTVQGELTLSIAWKYSLRELSVSFA